MSSGVPLVLSVDCRCLREQMNLAYLDKVNAPVP